MSRRRFPPVQTAVVLVVAATVFGLIFWWPFGSSENNRAPRPTPTSSSASDSGSVTASTPSTSAAPSWINADPSERPPVRPKDEMTDAGAEAFVRYWDRADDWAWATMDPTLVKAASFSSCELCAADVKRIEEDRAAGRRYEGGRYTLQRLVISPVSENVPPEPQDGTLRKVSLWEDATAWTVYGADGSVEEHDDPEVMTEYSMTIQWSSISGRWGVAALYIIKHVGS